MPAPAAPSISSRPFGVLPDGAAVECITLRNGGVQLSVLTYGAIIASLRFVADDGAGADVVLGFDTIEPYVDNAAYIGALVGRYANRIASGRFHLDGAPHQLALNDGMHHLHGGPRGFSRQVWTWSPLMTGDICGVRLSRTSPAGEEHYPGAVDVEVCYQVTPDGEVRLDYKAQTDAPTVLNLTQHSYFNLAGASSTNILDHQLTIHARSYTPVTASLIPTGAILDVGGTAFDFTRPTRIQDALGRTEPQLAIAGGFDHNFVLDERGVTPTLAAEVRDPSSGRTLRLLTTEPGLQFYDGHFLDGSMTGAYGRLLARHAGLCLEPQHFPDSPNQQGFASPTLRPGQQYRSSTIWQLTIT